MNTTRYTSDELVDKKLIYLAFIDRIFIVKFVNPNPKNHLYEKLKNLIRYYSFNIADRCCKSTGLQLLFSFGRNGYCLSEPGCQRKGDQH